MTKMNIYIFIMFMLVWIIIAESVEPIFLISGAFFAILCMYSMRKLLPLEPIKDICLIRLTLFPIFILGPMYQSGFYVLKLILKGKDKDKGKGKDKDKGKDAKPTVEAQDVKVTTAIKTPFLRVLLANSIALTPGSLPISLDDDVIHAIWLRPFGSPHISTLPDPGDAIKGNLENYIIKMEK